MSDWPSVPLGSLVKLRRGHDLPARVRRPGPIPVVSSGETEGWHDTAIADGPGVVIGRATNIGRPKWVAGPYWPHNTTLYVEDFRGNSPRWVFHLFQVLDLRGFNSGSVQAMLNRNFIANVPVTVPPLDEQRRIASVLSALDESIKTNRQAIRSIDRLAEAIFQRSMAHSGPVEVITLSHLVERRDLVLSDGYRTRADQLSESGIPILRVADVLDAEISPSYKDHILESFRPRMGVKVSQANDVLITTKGTVGRIALVPPGLPEHAYSPQLCFLRAINPAAFSPAWLYRWARSAEFMRQIGIVKDQTDMAPYVSLTDLRRVEMTLPSPGTRRAAEAQLAPLTTTTEALRQEIADVTAGRDELLPLLMSGRVRVSEDLAVA